jgi:hypothetical protein
MIVFVDADPQIDLVGRGISPKRLCDTEDDIGSRRIEFLKKQFMPLDEFLDEVTKYDI